MPTQLRGRGMVLEKQANKETEINQSKSVFKNFLKKNKEET